MDRQFAIVTGASTGIGYEFARICAREGIDLLIAADEVEIEKAARAGQPRKRRPHCLPGARPGNRETLPRGGGSERRN